MSFLLDTNVVSEWAKPRPDLNVATWLGSVDEDRVFLSVVTLAEIRQDIEQLPSGARRSSLDIWLSSDLPLRFEGRLLAIDGATADRRGRLMTLARGRGRLLSAMDGWIAATVVHHGLTLATRNVSDFHVLGIPIMNPWVACPSSICPPSCSAVGKRRDSVRPAAL